MSGSIFRRKPDFPTLEVTSRRTGSLPNNKEQTQIWKPFPGYILSPRISFSFWNTSSNCCLPTALRFSGIDPLMPWHALWTTSWTCAPIIAAALGGWNLLQQVAGGVTKEDGEPFLKGLKFYLFYVLICSDSPVNELSFPNHLFPLMEKRNSQMDLFFSNLVC